MLQSTHISPVSQTEFLTSKSPRDSYRIINPFNKPMNVFSTGYNITCLAIINKMDQGLTISESLLQLGYARQGTMGRRFIDKMRTDGLIERKQFSSISKYVVTGKGRHAVKRWIKEFRKLFDLYDQ